MKVNSDFFFIMQCALGGEKKMIKLVEKKHQWLSGHQ